MKTSRNQAFARRHGRRDFLTKSAGAVLAAGALAALGIPRRSSAAEPVNIGGLYPVTGSFAQIGQGCVNAAKLAVQMVNDAGGIKALGGAKLNLIISDVQSDTTVTRTETDRLISGYKLVGDPRLLCQCADADRERGGRTRESAAADGLEHRPAQPGPPLYLHAFRARFAVRQGAAADGQAGERQAEGGGGVREHRIRHLDLQGPARAGARRGRRDRLVRAVLGRLHRCQPADQQGQGVGREHAVPRLLSERPDPDHPRDQAGRPQDRHQRRLRRLRHSRLLQERREPRGRSAGRGALEPRHRRQCRRR